MKTKSRGFTLLELIAVIGIIATLAAILFPVLARVRENERRASCTSNMRQLSVGLAMYRNDYEEQNPGAARPADYCRGKPQSGNQPWWARNIKTVMQTPAPNQNEYLDPAAQWIPCYGIQSDQEKPFDPITNPLVPDWVKTGPTRGVLGPYIRDKSIFLCPSDAQPEKLLSYSMNQWAAYIPENEVFWPSNFIVFIDEQHGLNDGFFIPQNDSPTGVHNGGANFAFFDGHVRWLKSQQTDARCRNSVNCVRYCPQLPFDLYAGDMCKVAL